MSDSEDDYMSDKLLQQCCSDETEASRMSLKYLPRWKHEHNVFKRKQQVEEEIQRKSRKTIEEDAREEGLSTPIGSENRGFKMLEKMGYKSGAGLGKSSAGLVEPIKPAIKEDKKAGLGRERHVLQSAVDRHKRKAASLVRKADEFQQYLKDREHSASLGRDLFRAQKACEELDFKHDVSDPVEVFYWTKQTIKERLKVEEEDEDAFDETFHSYTSDENLSAVIGHLRAKYFYCLYCGFVASDAEDLQSNCPGPCRSDHDDM